jgi:hypothetical protein
MVRIPSADLSLTALLCAFSQLGHCERERSSSGCRVVTPYCEAMLMPDRRPSPQCNADSRSRNPLWDQSKGEHSLRDLRVMGRLVFGLFTTLPNASARFQLGRRERR